MGKPLAPQDDRGNGIGHCPVCLEAFGILCSSENNEAVCKIYRDYLVKPDDLALDRMVDLVGVDKFRKVAMTASGRR